MSQTGPHAKEVVLLQSLGLYLRYGMVLTLRLIRLWLKLFAPIANVRRYASV